jgi:gliding motility-associated-like protein
MKISIHVELPPNTPPVISSDLGTDSIGLKILDELFFQVIANDSDQDSIHLNAEGIDFDLESFGFSPLSLSGIGSLSEYFSWILECNTVNLDEIDQFSVLFTVEDDDKCKIKNGDSLVVKFTALLPENAKPQITITGAEGSSVEIIAGDSIQFEIVGFDPDDDFLILDIIDQNNLLEATGAVFVSASGKSSVIASFLWDTNCSHIASDFSSIPYNYIFVVRDDKCLVPASDSVDISLVVKNKIVNYDVFIPNVFTPNNDGINEYFMVDNLPEDNCINQFYNVSIYNRYGKEVFFSKDRDFKWIASNVDNGIYYYQIKYSGKDYRGYLHVLY